MKRARHANDHACWLKARDGIGAKKGSTLTSLNLKKKSNYAQYDMCSWIVHSALRSVGVGGGGGEGQRNFGSLRTPVQ